jgi:hypothetical protein
MTAACACVLLTTVTEVYLFSVFPAHAADTTISFSTDFQSRFSLKGFQSKVSVGIFSHNFPWGFPVTILLRDFQSQLSLRIPIQNFP